MRRMWEAKASESYHNRWAGIKSAIWLTVAILTIVIANSAKAENQCACPHVTARGVGNTSCSASEDRSMCTVDFNLFGPEREGRALEFLKKNGVDLIQTPNPSAPASEIPNTDPERMRDYVLLYLTIALADQFVVSGVTDSGQAALRSLAKAQQSPAFTNDVKAAFSSKAARLLPSIPDGELHSAPASIVAAARGEPLPDSSQVVTSPGCIEISFRSGVWLMFKTNWAAARLLSRCGEPR